MSKSIKIANFLIKKSLFYLLSLVNIIIPKSDSIIYLFDKRFRKDNVWAIADYLSKNQQYHKYKIYYYTKQNSLEKKNIKFISNSILALWIHLRAKYVFYSYRDIIQFKNARGQVIVDTMHGSPLKKIGYLTGSSKFKKLWKFEDSYSHILCVSDFFKGIIKDAFGANEEQCLVLGYPRNDLIFNKDDHLLKLNIEKNRYSKIMLWMPTYRGNMELGNNPDLHEAFPIINEDNVLRLNQYLLDNNVLIIIKPHPNQLELPLLKQSYSNIKILTNEHLVIQNVELYSLFSEVDVLLTDYSSVYFDFLLTLKPIGFLIDDLDNYGGTRGFTVEDPFAIMPGEKIISMNDLLKFIHDIIDDNDRYLDERKRVSNIANKYKDGNTCKRLVEYLGM